MDIPPSIERLTAEDFFTGLFAALARRRCATIPRSGQSFDELLCRAFDALRAEGGTANVQVDFRLRLHPVHGDSLTVREGVASAARRDLISLDNPIYQNIRLKLTPDDGEELLKDIPGGAGFFERLASLFLHQYQNAA